MVLIGQGRGTYLAGPFIPDLELCRHLLLV